VSALALCLKQPPLITFFVLAMAFSWGSAILSAVWPTVPFLFPYGPLLAALVVAAVTRGKDGLRELAGRCLRWGVGLQWYAAAILTPVALAIGATALNVLLGAPAPSADQLGPWYRAILLMPEVLLDAPLGEETGWRGSALPPLPAGGMALASSLVLGALIALWHLPIASRRRRWRLTCWEPLLQRFWQTGCTTTLARVHSWSSCITPSRTRPGAGSSSRCLEARSRPALVAVVRPVLARRNCCYGRLRPNADSSGRHPRGTRESHPFSRRCTRANVHRV
jgi:hypothetical protein